MFILSQPCDLSMRATEQAKREWVIAVIKDKQAYLHTAAVAPVTFWHSPSIQNLIKMLIIRAFPIPAPQPARLGEQLIG